LALPVLEINRYKMTEHGLNTIERVVSESPTDRRRSRETKNHHEDATCRREPNAWNEISSVRLLRAWWAEKAARRSAICPSKVERFLHQNSIPIDARLAVAKQVLRWAKDLEEEHLIELVEYIEALG